MVPSTRDDLTFVFRVYVSLCEFTRGYWVPGRMLYGAGIFPVHHWRFSLGKCWSICPPGLWKPHFTSRYVAGLATNKWPATLNHTVLLDLLIEYSHSQLSKDGFGHKTVIICLWIMSFETRFNGAVILMEINPAPVAVWWLQTILFLGVENHPRSLRVLRNHYSSFANYEMPQNTHLAEPGDRLREI